MPASKLSGISRILAQSGNDDWRDEQNGVCALSTYILNRANFFRSESSGEGLTPPELQDVRFHKLLKAWSSMFNGMAKYGRKTYGLQIRNALSPEFAETYISTDDVLLTHIIMNVFDNAMKACNSLVHVTILQREKDSIVIRFDDDGIGIEPDVLNHIFDGIHRDFEYAESRGFGLGMKWSKRLADQLGVKIVPRSHGEELSGASVDVVVPLKKKESQ